MAAFGPRVPALKPRVRWGPDSIGVRSRFGKQIAVLRKNASIAERSANEHAAGFFRMRQALENGLPS
jgi:hypothetical protein